MCLFVYFFLFFSHSHLYVFFFRFSGALLLSIAPILTARDAIFLCAHAAPEAQMREEDENNEEIKSAGSETLLCTLYISFGVEIVIYDIK